MKKLLSSILILAALSFTACKDEKKDDKTDATTPEKVEATTQPAAAQTAGAIAHVCGAECKDGNHVYAHTEVGHTCTDACGTAHTCGADCKDGNHLYAHGESGHTCTDACVKM